MVSQPFGTNSLRNFPVDTHWHVSEHQEVSSQLLAAGAIGKWPRKIDKKCQELIRLQSEFCTEDFFRAANFLTKNAPKISPKRASAGAQGE